MLKFFMLITLMALSFSSMANSLEQMMTIKERLRISLWTEGLNDQKKVPVPHKERQVLPEEIERPLRKL